MYSVIALGGLITLGFWMFLLVSDGAYFLQFSYANFLGVPYLVLGIILSVLVIVSAYVIKITDGMKAKASGAFAIILATVSLYLAYELGVTVSVLFIGPVLAIIGGIATLLSKH